MASSESLLLQHVECTLQCGFALLEAGSVRLKNTNNILLKNVINTCLGALTWWAVGEHRLTQATECCMSSTHCPVPAVLLGRKHVQSFMVHLSVHSCSVGEQHLDRYTLRYQRMQDLAGDAS